MSEYPDRQRPAGEPEPEPGPSEVAEARALAERLDRVLAGERVPADEVLAAALMVRASQHETALDPERRRELLDQALAEARAAGAVAAPRLRRWAPALALAASLLLLLGSLFTLLRAPRRQAAPSRMALPSALRSRSGDELMGRPFQDRAGASQRLDLVFADRLAGYRQVRFGGRSRR